jgi:steroid delta-isomerase-like uncharacterized protein
MMLEQNQEIIRKLYAEVTARNPYPGSYRTKGNRFTPYTVSAKPSSLKTFGHFFTAVSEAFPDYEMNIDNLITKGDRVMVRYTISGTHKGDFMGMPPTNEKMTITGIDVFRVDNGKVTEHWDAAHQMSAFHGLNREPVAASGSWRPDNPVASLSGSKQLSLST